MPYSPHDQHSFAVESPGRLPYTGHKYGSKQFVPLETGEELARASQPNFFLYRQQRQRPNIFGQRNNYQYPQPLYPYPPQPSSYPNPPPIPPAYPIAPPLNVTENPGNSTSSATSYLVPTSVTVTLVISLFLVN